jgi:Fe-S cluster assembly protein SufD
MSTETLTLASPEARFLAAFEVYDGHTLNGSNPTLQGLRRTALQHFARLRFPGRKDEAWKYTPIAERLRHDYRLLPAPERSLPTAQDLAAYTIPDLDAWRVVLVNGQFQPRLSRLDGLPNGVRLTSLSEASERHPDLFNRHFARYARPETDPFIALNTAFAHEGCFFYVPAQVVLEKPVHVIEVMVGTDDLFVQPRLLVLLEPGARATLIEGQHSRTAGQTFQNGVMEVYVGAGAEIDHYRLQDEGPQATQVATTWFYQEAASRVATLTATFSGALVRNNLSLWPDAEQCQSHLRGLLLGTGTMHVDNHTLVDHARPHCDSLELYKHILDDQATGVFNGRVYVRPDAQKTNAYQSNKSVLLSATAQMYAKPELEIYADDVKCSHGAATGRLREEALFYLKARGLPEAQARRLLLQAFAREVFDAIPLGPLRNHLDTLLEARLR